MTSIELLEKLPHGLNKEERENCGYSAHRLRRIRATCMRWESWRRRQGSMWVALNKGQAGAARGLRLLRHWKQAQHVGVWQKEETDDNDSTTG